MNNSLKLKTFESVSEFYNFVKTNCFNTTNTHTIEDDVHYSVSDDRGKLVLYNKATKTALYYLLPRPQDIDYYTLTRLAMIFYNRDERGKLQYVLSFMIDRHKGRKCLTFILYDELMCQAPHYKCFPIYDICEIEFGTLKTVWEDVKEHTDVYLDVVHFANSLIEEKGNVDMRTLLQDFNTLYNPNSILGTIFGFVNEISNTFHFEEQLNDSEIEKLSTDIWKLICSRCNPRLFQSC